MDVESWFEVTPENVAKYIAGRAVGKGCIIEGCSGVGGNSIQFAARVASVISIDTSADRLKAARVNAVVYGVQNRIEFVCSDVVDYLKKLEPVTGACFYISPPWGGRSCYNDDLVTLDSLPIKMGPIIRLAFDRVGSVILHLPRNLDLLDLASELESAGIRYYEVEAVYYTHPTRHLKFYLVYIDANLSRQTSIYSLPRDAAQYHIRTSLGMNRSARICATALVKINYFGRFILEVLRRDGMRGVCCPAVSVDAIGDLIGKPVDMNAYTSNPIQYLLDSL